MDKSEPSILGFHIPHTLSFFPTLKADIIFTYGFEAGYDIGVKEQADAPPSDRSVLQFQMSNRGYSPFVQKLKQSHSWAFLFRHFPPHKTVDCKSPNYVGNITINTSKELLENDLGVEVRGVLHPETFDRVASAILRGGKEILKNSGLQITLHCTEEEFQFSEERQSFPIAEIKWVCKLEID